MNIFTGILLTLLAFNSSADNRNPEYLDNLLSLSLKEYKYTVHVNVVGYEELEMWGDYKRYKIKTNAIEIFKGKLDGEICFLVQAEKPYPNVPFLPKTFIASFPEKESECYLFDEVNIFPAESRYFEKIKQYISSNANK